MAGTLVIFSGMKVTFTTPPGPSLQHSLPTPWQFNYHPGVLAQEDLRSGGHPWPSIAQDGTEHPTAPGHRDPIQTSTLHKGTCSPWYLATLTPSSKLVFPRRSCFLVQFFDPLRLRGPALSPILRKCWRAGTREGTRSLGSAR